LVKDFVRPDFSGRTTFWFKKIIVLFVVFAYRAPLKRRRKDFLLLEVEFALPVVIVGWGTLRRLRGWIAFLALEARGWRVN
jgi:hypothetical protein